MKIKNKLAVTAQFLGALMFSDLVLADTSLTLGGMASTITGSFEQLTKLITSASYLAGLGFSIGAIMKFKQHKDNPTQIPIGTPIALVFIAAALLFLPSILDVAGATMFGSSGGTVAGPTGIQYGS
jgi:intracellular multiplication protein IcmD